MKKIIGILLALSLLLVPTSVGADSGIEIVDRAGDGVWIETWWIKIYPGETKVTYFEFKNKSGHTLEVNLLIGRTGGLRTSWYRKSFTVAPGGSFRDRLRITADGSVPPGVYELTWKVDSKIVDVDPITKPVESIDEEPVGEEPTVEEPIEEPGEADEPVGEPDEEEGPVDKVGKRRQWPEILAVILLVCFAGLWFTYLIRERMRKNKAKEVR